MLDDLWNTPKKNKGLTDVRLYQLAVGLAIVTTLLAVGIALFPGNKTTPWTIWLQIGVAGLVFAFTVGGDNLTKQGKLDSRSWLILAGIICTIVFISSFFAGDYLNILLAPILVGVGQRRGDGRLIIYLSLSTAGLILLVHILFLLVGWQIPQSDEQGTIASIIALSGVGLSLATFLGTHFKLVETYREEAASKASEMEVAHDIQTSLMPPSEIVTGNWSMAARSIPARDVGGDFYEYIPYLDKGIGGIAIGDVAGKGIPAALQMAVVRTVFRIEARRRIFPAETLYSVNMALQAERSFGMVTMLYAFVDPATSTLHVANAGHNFPIILNGKMDEVRLPGLPLGIDDSVEYDERQMKIAPGTSVIFYTDGVVEAMDANGEMYGFENFRDAIMRYQNLEPRDMLDVLFKEISDFTQGAAQSDDITVLILQYARVESEEISPEDYGQKVDEMFASVNRVPHEEEPMLEGFEEESVNWI